MYHSDSDDSKPPSLPPSCDTLPSHHKPPPQELSSNLRQRTLPPDLQSVMQNSDPHDRGTDPNQSFDHESSIGLNEHSYHSDSSSSSECRQRHRKKKKRRSRSKKRKYKRRQHRLLSEESSKCVERGAPSKYVDVLNMTNFSSINTSTPCSAITDSTNMLQSMTQPTLFMGIPTAVGFQMFPTTLKIPPNTVLSGPSIGHIDTSSQLSVPLSQMRNKISSRDAYSQSFSSQGKVNLNSGSNTPRHHQR